MRYYIIKVEADNNDYNRDLGAEINEVVSSYFASRNISAKCDVIKSDFLSLHYKSEKGITKQISQSDIIYIEKNVHKVVVHTYHGTYEFYDSLKKVYEQLNPDTFMRVHQGFIVKISEIKVMYTNEVELNSIKIRIPLSRRNRRRLNQRFKRKR